MYSTVVKDWSLSVGYVYAAMGSSKCRCGNWFYRLDYMTNCDASCSGNANKYCEGTAALYKIGTKSVILV